MGMGYVRHAHQDGQQGEEEPETRNRGRDTTYCVCVHGSLPEVGRGRIMRPPRIYP